MRLASNAAGNLIAGDTGVRESGCCCTEPCPSCTGATPRAWLAEFSGVASGTCGSCTDYNSTSFEIPQDPVEGPCVWELYHANPTCETCPWMRVDFVGGGFITFTVGNDCGVPVPARFVTTSNDCAIVQNPTFSFQSGALKCNFAGATVTLTPLF